MLDMVTELGWICDADACADEEDAASLVEDEVMGMLISSDGLVVFHRTWSRMCITPLLTRKSDRMMFALTPLRVTLYDISAFCVNVYSIPESEVYFAC